MQITQITDEVKSEYLLYLDKYGLKNTIKNAKLFLICKEMGMSVSFSMIKQLRT